MRTRLVALGVLVSTSISLGGTAFAHGGGGGGHRAEHRGGNRFSFEMTGSRVPDGGDPRGAGQATLTLDPGADTVCLKGGWHGLDGDVTAIHIHKGIEGENGPHHIEVLNDERLAGNWNRVEFCVRTGGDSVHAHDAGGHGHEGGADPIEEILDDPAGFYLNIHTTAFPKGALRGQLA